MLIMTELAQELSPDMEFVSNLRRVIRRTQRRLIEALVKANNQITGADTKDVARAAKRIADAAIDLARHVKDL